LRKAEAKKREGYRKLNKTGLQNKSSLLNENWGKNPRDHKANDSRRTGVRGIKIRK